MPRVPTTPLGTVAPAQVTGARFQGADNNGGAFGAMGEGFADIGEAVSKFADAQDKIDDMLDDTVSRDKALEYQKRAAPLLTRYKSLTGLDAVHERVFLDEELAKLRDETLGSTAEGRQRRYTEARIEPLHLNATSQIGEHSTAQAVKYRDDTFEAQKINFAEQAATEWKSPGLSRAYLDSGLAVINDQVKAQGLSPAVGDAMKLDWQSNVHKMTVGAMLGEEDYEAADEYLNTYGDEIDAADELSLRAELKPGLDFIQAGDDVVRAYGMITPGADDTATVDVNGASTGAIPASGDPRAGFKTMIAGAESGGSYTITNKDEKGRDVAFGKYQYQRDTWIGEYAEMKGVSRSKAAAEFDKGRWKEPELSEQMMDHSTSKYEKQLKGMNVPVSAINLYVLHALGPALGGAMLKAGPNERMDVVLDRVTLQPGYKGPSTAAILASNGEYYRDKKTGKAKTVSEALGFMEGRLGGHGGKSAPAAKPPEKVSFKWQNPLGDKAVVTTEYGKMRDDGPHTATDLAGVEEGTAIKPMGPGKIKSVNKNVGDAAGYYVIIDHGNGYTSSYSHMKEEPKWKVGDAVNADTVVGLVGNTGNSRGAHLHLVVRKDGARIDPMSLIGQESSTTVGGDGPSQRQVTVPGVENKGQVYANIDKIAAEENWSPQRVERAKQKADRDIARDQEVKNINEREADKQADNVILQLGEEFTDISQIPADVRKGMSHEGVVSATRISQSNKERKEAIKPDSDTFIGLHYMSITDPEGFAKLNLSDYSDKVTRQELSQLVSYRGAIQVNLDQKAEAEAKAAKDASDKQAAAAAARAKGAQQIGPSTWSNIGRYTAGDKTIDDKEKRTIYDIAYPRLSAIYEKNGFLTDADYDEAIKWATRAVPVEKTGVFGTTKTTRPVYELTPEHIPDATRKRITSGRKQRGLPVDEESIYRDYIQNKGKPGYW